LYEEPFKDMKAMPLLGRMYDVYDRDTLFSKVIIETKSNKASLGPDDSFRRYDTHRMPSLEESRPYPGEMTMMGQESQYRGNPWDTDDDDIEDDWDE
jgi:hypothetical protein